MPSATPVLLIDSGNSRIKWALADGTGTHLAASVFDHAAAPAEWGTLPAPASIWVSNVAGQAVQRHIAGLLDAHWPQVPRHTVTSQARQCGVTNSYRDPAQLGSDRWASLLGAHAAYPGEALLIATLGTATTLEALLADGTFAGGLIAPGWASMMRALGQHTAQLPALSSAVATDLLNQGENDRARVAPPFAVDTPTSLSEGCLLAQAALLERAWHDLAARLAAPVRLVLGGGAAAQVAPALTIPHTRHDHLVLAGLALIAGELSRTQHPEQRQALPGATP